MLREKELALLENLKTDNEKKTEEIRQLRNNQLVGQVSGEETATITDGALAFANILEETEIEVEGAKRKAYVVKLPQGLSKQKVRQGYNSAKYDKETQTISEIKFTHNDDNSMKVNGTSTNYVTFKLNQEPITLKAGTYTLAVLYDKTIESGIDIHFDIRDNETSIGNILKSIYMTTNANSWKTSEITLEKETDVNLVYYVTNGATVENQTVKFMLLEGTYTAENLPEYEEYGESPSIEFPSPIKNIRAWNLFNAYIPKQNIGGVDVEFDEDTGILTLNGTCTETKQISFDRSKNKIKTKANTKYTFEVFKVSGKYTFGGTSEHGESSVQLWDNSSGTWKYPYQLIFNSFGSANKISVSHTYNVDILYNQVQFKLESGDIFDNFKIKIQFSEGDSKEYIPCGTVSIKAKNKNVFDKKEFEEETTIGAFKGKWYKIKPFTEYTVSTNISAGGTNLIAPVLGKPMSPNAYFVITTDKEATDLTSNNDGIYTTRNLTRTVRTGIEGWIYIGIRFGSLGELNKLDWWLQIEEGNSATPYTEHQEQNYNLHIGDLELNRIDDIRDSFVVELNDPSASAKSIKKLYKREIFESEQFFNGNEGWFLQNNIQQKTNRFAFDNFVNNEGISLSDFVSIISNKFKNYSANQLWIKDIEGIAQSRTQIIINVDAEKVPDLATFKQLLATEKIRYVCRKDEELIDLTDNTELVKEVEYLINNFKTFKEVTHVEVDNGYIDLEYVKSTELALKNIQQQIYNISALMLEGGTGNA